MSNQAITNQIQYDNSGPMPSFPSRNPPERRPPMKLYVEETRFLHNRFREATSIEILGAAQRIREEEEGPPDNQYREFCLHCREGDYHYNTHGHDELRRFHVCRQ